MGLGPPGISPGMIFRVGTAPADGAEVGSDGDDISAKHGESYSHTSSTLFPHIKLLCGQLLFTVRDSHAFFEKRRVLEAFCGERTRRHAPQPPTRDAESQSSAHMIGPHRAELP